MSEAETLAAATINPPASVPVLVLVSVPAVVMAIDDSKFSVAKTQLRRHVPFLSPSPITRRIARKNLTTGTVE